MSLVLTHVTIQIQFSVDNSNVVHTLENVFAHTLGEENSLKGELKSGLLPSCLDSGREQLIIFLLWVRILISISRTGNVIFLELKIHPEVGIAVRLSAPRSPPSPAP